MKQLDFSHYVIYYVCFGYCVFVQSESKKNTFTFYFFSVDEVTTVFVSSLSSNNPSLFLDHLPLSTSRKIIFCIHEIFSGLIVKVIGFALVNKI